jgi:hypothetical protein
MCMHRLSSVAALSVVLTAPCLGQGPELGQVTSATDIAAWDIRENSSGGAGNVDIAAASLCPASIFSRPPSAAVAVAVAVAVAPTLVFSAALGAPASIKVQAPEGRAQCAAMRLGANHAITRGRYTHWKITYRSHTPIWKGGDPIGVPFEAGRFGATGCAKGGIRQN